MHCGFVFRCYIFRMTIRLHLSLYYASCVLLFSLLAPFFSLSTLCATSFQNFSVVTCNRIGKLFFQWEVLLQKFLFYAHLCRESFQANLESIEQVLAHMVSHTGQCRARAQVTLLNTSSYCPCLFYVWYYTDMVLDLSAKCKLWRTMAWKCKMLRRISLCSGDHVML